MPTRPSIPAEEAASLLLAGAGLLDDPARPAGRTGVLQTIEALGYVQVDSIAAAERCHHHILMTRLDDYRRADLTHLLEADRALFEHWTHDASVIPTGALPAWKVRFERHRTRGLPKSAWWRRRMGPGAEGFIERVHEHVTEHGPIRARELEIEESVGAGESAWWGWTSGKAALEHLWRSGRLAIAGRVNFEKVYDLAERVHPEHHGAPALDHAAYIEWAMRAAFDRLVIATPGEARAFLNAVTADEAKAWTTAAQRRGELVQVRVRDAGGDAERPALALHDWRERLAALPAPPDQTRLLNPFDPAIRDRRRAERRFGFRHRFEAFVPAPQRVYGYYVLPILERDRLLGRVDARVDRASGTLHLLGPWWEPGVRPTRRHRQGLAEAAAHFAAQAGADAWTLAPPA